MHKIQHRIEMGNVNLSDVEGAGETRFNPFQIIIPHTKIVIVYDGDLEVTHYSDEPEGFQRLELVEAIALQYRELKSPEDLVLSDLCLCDDGKYRLEIQVD